MLALILGISLLTTTVTIPLFKSILRDLKR